MSWDFSFYQDSSLEDVYTKIERKLNDLGFQSPVGNNAAVTAKVAISDRKDGDAIGVVFFDESILIQPPPGGQIQFANKHVATSGSDPKDIFEEIKTKLNELNSTESFWSQLALTDQKSGNTDVVLFWPEAQD